MKRHLLVAMIMFLGICLKAQFPSITFTNITPACNNDASVQSNVTGGVFPYTYEWYSYTTNNVVANTPNFIGAPGYYRLTVTDANGVQNWDNVYLSGPFQINQTNVANAICPLSNGSITYTVNGGTPPYDVIWSHGPTENGVNGTSFTASGLAEGPYSIIVTDANGCFHNSVNDSFGYVNSVASFYVSMSGTPSDCHDGTLTANISGPVTGPLTYYWSTTPPQNTPTATGLDQGYYMVSVTDANGCSRSGYELVGLSANALDVYPSVTNATCPASNGSITAYANYGQPPYTYQWSTGANTQGISGLAPGHYTVTVNDAAGCSQTKVLTIYIESGFSINYTTTQSGCDNASGTASAIPSAGTPPYTYVWNNGATTQTATGLSAGYYHATVTDANGCTGYSWATQLGIDPNCYSSIEGNVYNDINGNCVLDPNETELPWQIISLGNGLYASTGYTGQYFVSSLTPQTYTVSHTPMQNWNPICPVNSYTLSPVTGQVLSGNNFYDQPVSLQNDVKLSIDEGLPRPGFSHTKSFSVYNQGSNTANGTVKIQHDVNEVYTGSGMYSSVIAYDQPSRTITIAYDHIAPFTYRYWTLNFSIPSSVQLGTILSTTGIADPIAGDNNPSDNYDTSLVTVVGSYDPNDKQVTPKGIGTAGLIAASNQYSEYTIRFQNTGTYYAETVAITDTLDEDLDMNTLQVIGSSHYLSWKLTGPRVLTFEFNNIFLPDSLTDEPGSHGYVTYRIKQKANLAGGTEIKNTAYIYFDYNSPIVTNTTLNTIQILGIKENSHASGFEISPNPASDKFTVITAQYEECEEVELIDISGRSVAIINPVSNVVTVQELATGVYIVKAKFKSGIRMKKLIISK